jgi:L-asparaginase II
MAAVGSRLCFVTTTVCGCSACGRYRDARRTRAAAVINLRSGAPLVEVHRSGVVESLHRGHLVVLDARGDVIDAVGAPAQPIFPRSSNKPLQAVGLRELGLSVPSAALALAAASHSGEPRHVAVVQAMLAQGGFAEDDLECPPDWPLGEAARDEWIAAGGGRTRVRMNCSGKHAAMMLACQANGWSVDGYPAADHPLQRHLAETVGRLADEPVAGVGVDGCGAPVFAITLLGLAHAYAQLVAARSGPEADVADAMRTHPELVGGIDRAASRLMAGVPGLLAKDGAEGVFAAALAGAGAVAVKIDDGATRAAECALIAGLHRLSVTGEILDEQAEAPVTGGGATVGALRIRPGLFTR